MKNNTLKKIILIAVAIILILCVTIFIKDKIAERNRSAESRYKIDKNVAKELKEDLGHGSAGDIIKIEEGKDSEGNRTYELSFKDGSKQTVTIRKAKEGESGTDLEKIDDTGEDSDSGTGDSSDTGDTKPEAQTVYEKYCLLSPEEKEAFFYTFKSTRDFYSWYNAAEQEYKDLHPTIIVGKDEIIDFGDK